MIRTLIAAIACCTLLYSCSEGEKPHLPREKMKDIITDIHLAEVYSTFVTDSLHRPTNKNLDSLAFYYKSILSHHKVSLGDFQNSLDWYMKNPKELDSTYVSVLAEISTLEGVLGISSQ